MLGYQDSFAVCEFVIRGGKRKGKYAINVFKISGIQTAALSKTTYVVSLIVNEDHDSQTYLDCGPEGYQYLAGSYLSPPLQFHRPRLASVVLLNTSVHTGSVALAYLSKW